MPCCPSSIVQRSQGLCLANVLWWLLIGLNDLWHLISSSSWPLGITLLMATLKTEAILTTSHLMVLVLINITNTKMTVRLMGTLNRTPNTRTYIHTPWVCWLVRTHTHTNINIFPILADIILPGIWVVIIVSMKNKTERPRKPPLTCLYGASLGTLMDGLLPPTGSPRKALGIISVCVFINWHLITGAKSYHIH